MSVASVRGLRYFTGSRGKQMPADVSLNESIFLHFYQISIHINTWMKLKESVCIYKAAKDPLASFPSGLHLGVQLALTRGEAQVHRWMLISTVTVKAVWFSPGPTSVQAKCGSFSIFSSPFIIFKDHLRITGFMWRDLYKLNYLQFVVVHNCLWAFKAVSEQKATEDFLFI